MSWRLALFALAGFSCQLQSGVAATLAKSKANELNYDLVGKFPVRWSGGALSAVEGQSSSVPVVRLFGRDGVQLAALAVSIPQARIVGVASVARGNDGMVAVAGGAAESDGRSSGFIALYPADGSTQRVIPIPSEVYIPTAIAVVADGSIWTAGVPLQGAPDQNIFWHFDSTGNKIGSAVGINKFSGSLAVRSGLLATSSAGLVWICPKDGRYLEFSLDGTVTADTAVNFPAASLVSGVAVTADGQAFVQVQTGEPRQITICSVDKKSGGFTSLATSADFLLLGADGNTLVGHAKTRIVSADIVP